MKPATLSKKKLRRQISFFTEHFRVTALFMSTSSVHNVCLRQCSSTLVINYFRKIILMDVLCTA